MKVRIYPMMHGGRARTREEVKASQPLCGDLQVVHTTEHGSNRLTRVIRLRLEGGGTSELTGGKLVWANRNKMVFRGIERVKVREEMAWLAQTWLAVCDRLPACRMMPMRESGMKVSGTWYDNYATKGEFGFLDRHCIDLRRTTSVAQLHTGGGRYTKELYDAELMSLKDNFFIVTGFEHVGREEQQIQYAQGWRIRIGYEDDT
jgi:hypothetical protein